MSKSKDTYQCDGTRHWEYECSETDVAASCRKFGDCNSLWGSRHWNCWGLDHPKAPKVDHCVDWSSPLKVDWTIIFVQKSYTNSLSRIARCRDPLAVGVPAQLARRTTGEDILPLPNLEQHLERQATFATVIADDGKSYFQACSGSKLLDPIQTSLPSENRVKACLSTTRSGWCWYIFSCYRCKYCLQPPVHGDAVCFLKKVGIRRALHHGAAR